VLIRLGRLEPAGAAVDAAATALSASGRSALDPALQLARGELEAARGAAEPARRAFHASAAAWVDDAPDAASVESSCLAAFLDRVSGAAAGQQLRKAIDQAGKMGRTQIQRRCTALSEHLARGEASVTRDPGVLLDIGAVRNRVAAR
jgi:hypothetical protein